MTLAVTILKKSWKELIRDSDRGVFVPCCERDVQCYLYHLCIKNGLDRRKIHADKRYGPEPENRLYTDLVLGNRPDTRLYVELKYIRVTKDGSISERRANRIRSDIRKCKKMKSKRNRYDLVFLYRIKKTVPLKGHDLTKDQRRGIHELESGLATEGVKVLFSV